MVSIKNKVLIKILWATHSRDGYVNSGYVPNFGGNRSNTTNAGAFYVNFNNSASNANSNYGGRLALCVIKKLNRVVALPLGKI